MSGLTDLANIGEKLADELQRVGITTPDQLIELGSVEAALRITHGRPLTGYNILYALEGAIRSIRWHAIKKENLLQIREEYNKRLEDI